MLAQSASWRRGMRSLILTTMMLLAGFAPARADLEEFSYSAVVGTTLGVLHANDTISGVAVWDSTNFSTNACPGNLVYAICLPLITDTLSVSGSSDLSIPGGGAVVFAGAPEVTQGVFTNLQIKEESPVDNNFYTFFIYPTVIGVDEFSNPGGTLLGSTDLTSLTTSGPSPVPEPASWLLLATVAAAALHRARAHRLWRP